MGYEGASHGASGDGLHHGSLHFDKAVGIEVAAEGLN